MEWTGDEDMISVVRIHLQLSIKMNNLLEIHPESVCPCPSDQTGLEKAKTTRTRRSAAATRSTRLDAGNEIRTCERERAL